MGRQYAIPIRGRKSAICVSHDLVVLAQIADHVFVLRFVDTNRRSRAVDPFGVFSARDLRLRSGAFLKNSEEGHLALVTKHGRPSILAVPFTERLLELGVHRTLALHLFENRHLTLARAAKLAAMTLEEFVELLGHAGIPAADYPPEELDDELRTAS